MHCRPPALLTLALFIQACAGCGAFSALMPGVGNVPGTFLLPGGDGQSSFLLHGGYVIVDATINDAGPYKFLLDTGAGVTVVSPKIADALPQNVIGTASIVSSVDPNSVNTKFLLVDHLQMGPVVFEHFQVAILPELSITSNGQTVIADGILGSPLYRNLSLTVDYPGQTVRLRDSAAPSAGDCALPVQSGPGDLPSLALKVAGRDVVAVIDTGNNEFLLLPSSFGDLPFSGPTHNAVASTVTGTLTTIKGTLDGSVQAGCALYDRPTVTVGGHIASLGARAFIGHTITLDQTSGRFWFQSSAQ